MANVCGIDTGFLVSCEIIEASNHQQCRSWLRSFVADQGGLLAITPQVLAEFIHVVTDPKRFSQPLGAEEAFVRAKRWWHAAEVRQLFPNPNGMALFFQWMNQHKLGRKRILDTMLASTLLAHEVREVVTTNSRDFSVFDCFQVHSVHGE